MEVKRIDIYDFRVVLTEPEFNELKFIAERALIEIDDAFAQTLSAGLDIIAQDGF